MMDEETLRGIAASIGGVEVGEGAFAPGIALWVGRREIAHFDGPNVLDVRMTRALIRTNRDELNRDGRVRLRRSTSDWLGFDVSDGDTAAVTMLITQAVAANLPTAPDGPPPSGADLERRRRFH
ncbi:MAG: hypothetical protein QOF60_1406 [Actinomycetota bacterium]|jgi:hypothetical protein|nr:hypothetical protein [Actinomycetota bacterium]